MQNLQSDLISLLRKDERFIAEGKLLKNSVIEAALKLDPVLLKLLISHKTLKKHFFSDIDGVLVFDKIEFQKFISNKSFLKDSYTAFTNKIGLTSNDEFISEGKDVVLSWPYKDCVLEGGQSKEDEKRDEIFWNETLAPDEIDRLLSPKVFTNFKKYDSKGAHKVTDISLEDNLIIKGNNLLALHSLLPVYSGRIKLIYIDPPYNTGNDSFQYNDSFNHSTWLSFMRSRLSISKELLSVDGSIFISIDENEIGYLNVLCDEIFGRENRANLISIKRGSVTGHKSINPGAVNITEYLIAYAKNKNNWKPSRIFKSRARNERYNTFIKNRQLPTDSWGFTSLLNAFAEFQNVPKNKVKKLLGESFESKIFDFIKKNADAVVQLAYPDIDKVSKEVKNIIKVSEKSRDKVFHIRRIEEPDIYLINGQRILFYSDRLLKIDGEYTTGEPISDFWDDVLPNDLHNEGGVSFKKGKKPEKLIQRIVDLATLENDIILDYHVGSGTSSCVSLKTGRRFIGIEQLDYKENGPITRLQNTIKGEQSGISKATNWKGGGSFIHCELSELNIKYVNQISAAKTTKKLKQIWKTIKKDGFVSYKVNPKDIDNSISIFEELSLPNQKKFLSEVLDKNHLYVNFSEIDDKDYNISTDDKKLNKKFYSLK